jgi:hypothetical protein
MVSQGPDASVAEMRVAVFEILDDEIEKTTPFGDSSLANLIEFFYCKMKIMGLF